MASELKLKQLQIEVRPGITLIAEVSTLDDVKAVLAAVQKAGLLDPSSLQAKTRERRQDDDSEQGETPERRVEIRAGLDKGTLATRQILGFKDGVPQLLRPNTFSTVSDAALVLMFAIESGLRQSSIPFEEFKAVFEEQNIKSGSSLSMLLNNLKNAGYLDKKSYLDTRKLRLAAKGERKAIEVLKDYGN
jgi:hypothetical protein